MKKYKAKLLNQASDKVGAFTKVTGHFMTYWKGRDLLLTGYGKNHPEVGVIEPDATYEIKVPIFAEVTVKKELKRQIKKNGFQGVADYLTKFIDD